MIVTVQELGQSKSGKPKVKANNNWYFLASDRDTGFIATPGLGQVIEIKSGSFAIDGKTFLTLEAWRPAAATSSSQPVQVAASQARAMPTQTADMHQAFIGQGFISNVVGQAIVAGLIKSPGQVFDWYNAAKLALEGKKAAVPFSDNLPRPREPGQDDEGSQFGEDDRRDGW